MDKVKDSLLLIEKHLKLSKNPIVACSFGKDSLVMLHLIRMIEKTPVLYFREPYFQSKFEYPQIVSQGLDLEVYDYPPTSVDYLQIGDYFDVYNFYGIGKNRFINLYTGIRKYKETDKYLCTVKDLLGRPTVTGYTFKWDCVFYGHKQCDPVYITDRIELYDDRKVDDITFVLPLKDWTDQNVWDFIKKYNVPYNVDRYDKGNESKNNDVFPACYDCLDYRNIGKEVLCPKLNKSIDCVAKTEKENQEFRNKLLTMQGGK